MDNVYARHANILKSPSLLRTSRSPFHCISPPFIFLDVFLTELPSLQIMDTTPTCRVRHAEPVAMLGRLKTANFNSTSQPCINNKPDYRHPRNIVCSQNTQCRRVMCDAKNAMVTTPTSLQLLAKNILLLIVDYTPQIVSLSKSCKRLWILLHGLRIGNTKAWKWVTKDIKPMNNVCHLMAHFNDNTSTSLRSAKGIY